MRRKKSDLSKNTAKARAVKKRRRAESSTQCSQRMFLERLRNAQARARETIAERAQRLANNRARASRVRARETSVERARRLARRSEKYRLARDKERAAVDNQMCTISYASSYDPTYPIIHYAQQNNVADELIPNPAGTNETKPADFEFIPLYSIAVNFEDINSLNPATNNNSDSMDSPCNSDRVLKKKSTRRKRRSPRT